LYNVGESLFRPTKKAGGVWDLEGPWLAKSYELAPDLSKAIVHLQEGVQFHKGWGEMTAEDVAWSVNDANAATTPTSIHGQAGDFAALFGEWKAVDRYTVEVPFVGYDVRWVTRFANYYYQAFSVLSKTVYDEKGEVWTRENIIATGPFEVIQWVRDDVIHLKAVADHWYRTAKAKEVRLLEIPELSTRKAMLETGELDAADIDLKLVPDLLREGFESTTNMNVHQEGVFFSGNLWETHHARTGEPLSREGAYRHDLPWIGNPDDPDDMEEARKVRWAMAVAVDREAINENVFEGLGWPVYITYLSPKHSRWQGKWSIPYDPEEGRALLKETEWPNGFESTLFVGPELGGGPGPAGELGDAIGGYWAEIGITTQVLKYAYAVHRPGLVGRTTTIPFLTTCDEGDGPQPWDWPKALVMSSLTRGGFCCGLESPFFSENYLKAAAEPDIEKRSEYTEAFADYQSHWKLDFGVVAVPVYVTYNPKSIAEWDMDLCVAGVVSGLDQIVPASTR